MDFPVLRPDQFMVMFPSFALMSADCRGGVVQHFDRGIAVVIFTDEANLDDYREKQGLLGPLIRFDSAPQLCMYFDSLPQNVTLVVFDPSAGKPKVFLLADVMSKILESGDD